MRLIFLQLVLSLFLLTPLSAQNYTFKRDIAYRVVDSSEYSKQMCRLDVAFSDKGKNNSVIVWFHGGGLTSGQREIPRELLHDNFTVVGVEYRLSPHVSIHEIIDDAAAAVSWVFDHIAEYNGSTDQIYVSGHSAGGYLASIIALDKSRLEQYGKDADHLAGIIPFSGQVITHFEERKQEGIEALQPRIGENAPLFHLRKEAAPFLIICGDREMELYGRYEENAYFYRMLKLVGHPDVTLYELQGFDHGGMCRPALPLAVKFIKSRQIKTQENNE